MATLLVVGIQTLLLTYASGIVYRELVGQQFQQVTRAVFAEPTVFASFSPFDVCTRHSSRRVHLAS